MDAASLPSLPEAGPIDLGLLNSLQGVSLRARYLVDCLMNGRHRSPLRGTAPEFAEYRAYQWGDDVRRIDWKLFGRSDRVAVKQYEDESQMQVCGALDLSASMRFASRPDLPTKFDVARTLLAGVALLARRQHDPVGFAALGSGSSAKDPGIVDQLQPGTSPGHHVRLLGHLEDPARSRTVSLGLGLRKAATVIPKGGVMILASDLYFDVTEVASALHFLRSQRIELVALRILDPMELEFPADNRGQFVDLETGARQSVDAAACREGYLRRFNAHRTELAEAFTRHGADLVDIRTDQSPLGGLTAYLAARRSRSG